MTLSRVNSKSIIGKALTFHLFLEWQPGVFAYYFLSEGGDGGVRRQERSIEKYSILPVRQCDRFDRKKH